jgi:hypothetical protein
VSDHLLKANPLYNNPLKSRDDVAKAVRDLFAPLLPHFSPGGARVELSATAALFDCAAADLEGFARPLWGIVPLAAGGGAFEHWAVLREGLANGTDPEHPEYWGDIYERDQRLVELAAIGFGLRLANEHLWVPLDARQKANVAAYLLQARQRDYVDNNWKFFRILVDLGLEECGIEFDRSLTEKYLDELDGFYMSDGWYRDGPVNRVDHYIPFAMHFYALIYAVVSKGDDARAATYRERAKSFAPNIRHWFGADGAALPFGRSQTYRFAAAGFWGALAYAGVEALPWGEIKGYFMRHLRWWAQKPIADRDGVLSIGYGYPNLLMSESYNSACSPYWALKAFLPLALPADHPFWQAEEIEAPSFKQPVTLAEPGMVAMHVDGDVVVLSSGQDHDKMRGAAEKYAKFAYHTRYGFGVEADDRNFDWAGFDSMIGFSDDGVHFRAREMLDDALIAEDKLYSVWRPWADVRVETWLIPQAPWHIRVHRIQSARALKSKEGGFAIPRADFRADVATINGWKAQSEGAEDISVIVDLAGGREARVTAPIANTNLIHAKTNLPQLVGDVPVGTTVFYTGVVALQKSPTAFIAASQVPTKPDIGALEALFRKMGARVGARLVNN